MSTGRDGVSRMSKAVSRTEGEWDREGEWDSEGDWDSEVE